MPADLTVLVPCFNEEARIDPCLARIRAWSVEHAEVEVEVVVADDGSTDGTADRTDAWSQRWPAVRLVSAERNEGKGAALRRGVAASRGRVVVFFDADLAVDVPHLDLALAVLEGGADLAVGCRNIDGAAIERSQGRVRRWLGRGYLTLARWLLGLDVPDVTCGFKGFRIEAARALFKESRCNRFGFDAEILALAQRAGYRVETFPVVWVDSDRSTVRLGRDLIGAFRELIATRLRVGSVSDAPAAVPSVEPASAGK